MINFGCTINIDVDAVILEIIFATISDTNNAIAITMAYILLNCNLCRFYQQFARFFS